MLHSNKIFDVTGCMEDLCVAISAAVRVCDDVKLYTREDDPVRLAWRVTGNGKYFCIQSGSMASEPESEREPGWTDFEGPYDPEAFAEQIKAWLETRPYPYVETDGSVEKGFRCRSFDWRMIEDCDDEFELYEYVFACFEPWTCEFAQ